MGILQLKMPTVNSSRSRGGYSGCCEWKFWKHTKGNNETGVSGKCCEARSCISAICSIKMPCHYKIILCEWVMFCQWFHSSVVLILILIDQRHIRRKHLLNASQFGFRANHSMTLQCMRLTDYVNLNFNNKMSTGAALLDIKKPLRLYGTHTCYIKKNKLHGLSSRANYIDWATAACQRSDCQLLRIEGAMWSAWRIPMAVFSVL
jgi:hypothetical protein